jgi:hypothetical protein
MFTPSPLRIWKQSTAVAASPPDWLFSPQSGGGRSERRRDMCPALYLRPSPIPMRSSSTQYVVPGRRCRCAGSERGGSEVHRPVCWRLFWTWAWSFLTNYFKGGLFWQNVRGGSLLCQKFGVRGSFAPAYRSCIFLIDIFLFGSMPMRAIQIGVKFLLMPHGGCAVTCNAL